MVIEYADLDTFRLLDQLRNFDGSKIGFQMNFFAVFMKQNFCIGFSNSILKLFG